MVCKNRGIYGFLSTSWVLITYNVCPPGIDWSWRVGIFARNEKKTHSQFFTSVFFMGIFSIPPARGSKKKKWGIDFVCFFVYPRRNRYRYIVKVAY